MGQWAVKHIIPWRKGKMPLAFVYRTAYIYLCAILAVREHRDISSSVHKSRWHSISRTIYHPTFNPRTKRTKGCTKKYVPCWWCGCTSRSMGERRWWSASCATAWRPWRTCRRTRGTHRQHGRCSPSSQSGQQCTSGSRALRSYQPEPQKQISKNN